MATTQNQTAKKALVLGISGNFGSAMAWALHNSGWQVTALLRDPGKAPDWLAAENCIEGDAGDESLLSEIAQDIDLLVYGVNPLYHRWSELAEKMLEPSVRVAERFGLTLLFPGNIYNFTPTNALINEDTPMAPPTEKGRIRVAMEKRLKQASQQGAKVIIIRAGDFITDKPVEPNQATTQDSTWFSQIVSYKSGRLELKLPHNSQHRHYWSYLPDLCANTATLIHQIHTEPTAEFFTNWLVLHDPGLVIVKADWLEACHQLGIPVRTKSFPWWLISMMSLVSPLLREVNQMRYLWQQPVIADGQQFRMLLSDNFQSTTLNRILQQKLTQGKPTQQT